MFFLLRKALQRGFSTGCFSLRREGRLCLHVLVEAFIYISSALPDRLKDLSAFLFGDDLRGERGRGRECSLKESDVTSSLIHSAMRKLDKCRPP